MQLRLLHFSAVDRHTAEDGLRPSRNIGQWNYIYIFFVCVFCVCVCVYVRNLYVQIWSHKKYIILHVMHIIKNYFRNIYDQIHASIYAFKTTVV
jgi:hypothetical protein